MLEIVDPSVDELVAMAAACDREGIRKRLVQLLPDHDANHRLDV